MHADHAVRASLHADRHAAGTARVLVHGNHATIELPTALLDGKSAFLWTESCWMLTG